jgi:predicted peroxiredoxin
MAGRFCVTLRHAGDDADAATMAFITASAAAASEKETLVFLTLDGVNLSQKGVAEEVNEPGLPPLRECMDKYLAAGGKILACSTCFRKRGLDEKALVPGVAVAGAPVLVAFLSDGAPSVSF